MASSDGAKSWPLREDAIHTRLAHFVVTFWVDLKPHVRVEISRGLADRAYSCKALRMLGNDNRTAHHLRHHRSSEAFETCQLERVTCHEKQKPWSREGSSLDFLVRVNVRGAF